MTTIRNYTYAIIRHGSNSINQSMCDKTGIDVVEAKNKSDALCEAKARAEKGRYIVYNNQWLKAAPLSSLSKAHRFAIEEKVQQDEDLVNTTCMLCGKAMGRLPMWQAGNTYCGCRGNQYERRKP